MAKNTRLENQILHFSNLKKWDKVESHWTQVVEDPPANPKFYATVARRMVKAEKVEDLKSWIMLAVESCVEAGADRRLVQLCRGVLLALPDFEELREPLVKALRSFYADNDRTDDYIEESGLKHEAALYEPLNRFFLFIACSPGEIYTHGNWGQGCVESIDTRDNKVVVDFGTHGKRTFTFEGVREFLSKVPKSHLHARRITDPEGLASEANDKPVDFMKYCLKCLGGGASRAQLKEELTQGVFKSREWNAWWTKNRDAFRIDPYIAFSGSPANPSLQLRDEPEFFHEEMLRAFRKAEVFSDRCSLVQDLLKVGRSYEVPAEALAELQNALGQSLANLPEAKRTERIEYLCLIREVAAARGDDTGDETARKIVEIVAQADQPAEVVGAISVVDYQLQAAACLRDTAPEQWPELAEELFLAGPARLGQWVLRDLIEHKHVAAAEHMAEQLLHRPYENTTLYLWLVRALRDEKLEGLHIEVEADQLVRSALDLLSDCQQRIDHEAPDTAALRGLKSRLEGLLSENRHVLMTDVFETYETDEARRRYAELMDCTYLSESFKISLDHALRAVRHDLEDSDAANEHFVTAESLERKTKEYQHIKTVEIPQNSKAIGAAAALGDLSENAEYDAAKERQKVLFRRIEALQDQLQRARVMETDNVQTGEIGFGTTFDIKNMDSGETERYTMLGLWDADPEKHVLSYETPFGKQFLKRKVGDILIVTHPGGGSTQYKVLAIENALKAGASSA